MLEVKQIRKMIKPMSDRQICNDKYYADELIVTKDAWGHGAIIFFEPAPKVAREWYAIRENGVVAIESLRKRIDGHLEECWPVFIGEAFTADLAVIRFQTEKGQVIEANARYAVSMLKKAGRIAHAINAIKWYTCPVGSTQVVVADLAGQFIGVFAQLGNIDIQEWIWQLKNEDIPQPPQPRKVPAGQAALPQLAFGF